MKALKYFNTHSEFEDWSKDKYETKVTDVILSEMPDMDYETPDDVWNLDYDDYKELCNNYGFVYDGEAPVYVTTPSVIFDEEDPAFGEYGTYFNSDAEMYEWTQQPRRGGMDDWYYLYVDSDYKRHQYYAIPLSEIPNTSFIIEIFNPESDSIRFTVNELEHDDNYYYITADKLSELQMKMSVLYLWNNSTRVDFSYYKIGGYYRLCNINHYMDNQLNVAPSIKVNIFGLLMIEGQRGGEDCTNLVMCFEPIGGGPQ